MIIRGLGSRFEMDRGGKIGTGIGTGRYMIDDHLFLFAMRVSSFFFFFSWVYIYRFIMSKKRRTDFICMKHPFIEFASLFC